jgi:hypothetical protein
MIDKPQTPDLTITHANVLQTTRQLSPLKKPKGGFKVTRLWSIQLCFKRPNRCQNCSKGWSLTEDHHFGVFEFTDQLCGIVLRWSQRKRGLLR